MYNLLHRKNENFPQTPTVDTSNLQPGELIYVDFAFYNLTFIRKFISVLTVFCAKNRIVWQYLMYTKDHLSASSGSS